MTLKALDSDIPIEGIECDSRRIRDRFLFVAIRGAKLDGCLYLKEAMDKGAAALVVETGRGVLGKLPCIEVSDTRIAAAKLAAAFYQNPSKKMKTIGITGTNGKTTSSYFLEHFLLKENKKVGVIGTVNYRMPGKSIPAVETTPGPLRIQAILSDMARAGCQVAVMEVSSHALDQKRIYGVHFERALFTNLTQDHLDYHKTMEAYFEAKLRLFSGLSKNETSVINADDPWAQRLQKKIVSNVLTYGITHEAAVRALDIRYETDKTLFKIGYSGKKYDVVSPLIGRHNVYNVLGAIATGISMGISPESLAGHVCSFGGVPGRMETIDCGQDFAVIVDFAHTPDGLENVLSSLMPYKKKRLVSIFGCGGDRDKTKRPLMGRIASRYCDFIYVTSDNPRSEDPAQIAKDICVGFPGNFDRFSIEIDRSVAIKKAIQSAGKDDIILLAGKGHEETQVLGNKSVPFSDRTEARRALREN